MQSYYIWEKLLKILYTNTKMSLTAVSSIVIIVVYLPMLSTEWSTNCLVLSTKKTGILTKRPPVAATASVKYFQQKSQHFYKMAAWSYHCPLWHEHRHWFIGIPGYTFHPDQSIPTTFLCSAYLVTTGSLHSTESPMGVLTFNSTENTLKFTIYDYILRFRQKRCNF